MTNLVPFTYNEQTVRTVEIDGEPWFVAADVCTILEIGRVYDAVRGLDDDERGTDTIRTLGGDQQVTTVNEPGLYSLIMRSRKPEARAFKRWITHEVLPQIRQHGGYVNPNANIDQLDRLARQAESQARVLSTLSGIVNPQWLEAKARHVTARALGEEPEIDPQTRPLTVGEYLDEQGVRGQVLRKLSPQFGKLLAGEYYLEHGEEPYTVDRFVENAVRPVKCYTETDRPLFDRVWCRLVGTESIA